MADRDVRAVQSTAVRLDTEEKAAKDRPQTAVTARDVRRYLTDLPKLWRQIYPGWSPCDRLGGFRPLRRDGLGLLIQPSAEAERYGWPEACGAEPLVIDES